MPDAPAAHAAAMGAPPVIQVAIARVVRDFLGRVVGMHGVAPAIYNGEPAVALLGVTPRPPALPPIPGQLVLIVDGVRHAIPLVWIRTAPTRPGSIVSTGNEVVVP
jgi:hypothetical protein